IDTSALQAEIASWYSSAGLRRHDVDTGAVILTGTALLARNSRELANLFSDEGGTFVCATAGHALEATLAAHGSGSVARSRRDHETILHVDVGGGTTKLALIEDGAVVATSAIAVGARSHHASRDPDERRRIAGELAAAIVAATRGAPRSPVGAAGAARDRARRDPRDGDRRVAIHRAGLGQHHRRRRSASAAQRTGGAARWRRSRVGTDRHRGEMGRRAGARAHPRARGPNRNRDQAPAACGRNRR